MDHLPREMRLSGTARGIIIAVLMGAYGWVFHLPAASMTWTFLIAAVLQLVVILMRHFIPAANLPVMLYMFELFADAATVFMFALGVYGGLLKMATDA
jgi:hypothetical protein